MKIHFYSFRSNQGTLLNAYNRYLNDNVDAHFFVSKYSKKISNEIICYPKYLWIINKILLKVLKTFRVPYYVVRHFDEKIYDLYFSKKLKEGVIIVTTSGWIPKLINKNKSLGGYCIIFAGNPCDLEISLVLSSFRNGGLKIKDIYSYKPKLSVYEESINKSDVLIVFNEYIKKTFLPHVDFVKVKEIYGKIPHLAGNIKQKSFPKREQLTFCYIAHTILLKGLHVLLDAWEKSNTENSQLIIGGSIQRELKQDIIGKISQLPNVHYVGKVEDLAVFFQSSHVSICPSLIDAGPRTIIEAMSFRLPVIASENCGNAYLIKSKETGLIYKNNDSNELSECIDWFAQNHHLIEQMGEEANNRIQKETENENNFYISLDKIIKSLK